MAQQGKGKGKPARPSMKQRVTDFITGRKPAPGSQGAAMRGARQNRQAAERELGIERAGRSQRDSTRRGRRGG